MFQLNEIFGKKVPMKIFIFFSENPSLEFSETEVRKKLKLSRGSTNKWLNLLLKYKILTMQVKGRMNLYKLNIESPLVKQLRILFNISKIFPLLDGVKNVQIYLYGSVARGEDLEDSDIDLLIIGKKSEEILTAIRKIENNLGKRVKASFYNEVEWSQIARKDPAFYERVEKDKIRLI
ncbi:MAG: nucleotidyltransferase domain-containing protein [Candidatus Aenigmatarchaeota archaeon]